MIFTRRDISINSRLNLLRKFTSSRDTKFKVSFCMIKSYAMTLLGVLWYTTF